MSKTCLPLRWHAVCLESSRYKFQGGFAEETGHADLTRRHWCKMLRVYDLKSQRSMWDIPNAYFQCNNNMVFWLGVCSQALDCGWDRQLILLQSINITCSGLLSLCCQCRLTALPVLFWLLSLNLFAAFSLQAFWLLPFGFCSALPGAPVLQLSTLSSHPDLWECPTMPEKRFKSDLLLSFALHRWT